MSLVRRPARPPRFRRGAALGVALLSVAVGGAVGAQQFRSTVSLVAVDVQVLDRQGNPIPALTAKAFEVTIGGRRRRVVSVDSLAMPRRPASAGSASPLRSRRRPPRQAGPALVPPGGSSSWPSTAGASTSRPGSASRLHRVRLWPICGPDDRIGVYTYPDGPVLLPSTDHVRMSMAIAGVRVGDQALVTQFNLTPSEVVDIAAESVRLVSPASAVRRTREQAFDQGADAPTVQAVHLRECPTDAELPGRILLDANSAVHQLESRALESLAGLDGMTRTLAEWPGRKTIVSPHPRPRGERPAGRPPDPGDVSRALGQTIARANASLYTLHVESNPREQFAASRRTMGRPGVDMARGAADAVVVARAVFRSRGRPAASRGSGRRRGRMATGASRDRGLLSDRRRARTGRPRRASAHATRESPADRGRHVRSRMWVVVPAER